MARRAKVANAHSGDGLVDFNGFLADFGSAHSIADEAKSVKVEEIHQVVYDESAVVEFESYVDGFGHREFVEDKKSKFVNFVSDLLGVPAEEAAAMYDASLKGHFKRAAQTSPLPENYLCVPQGEPEKYLGKGKSGEIYAFLERVYPYRAGAEALTADYLDLHDRKALLAFRGRRRTAPVPAVMLTLTREGMPSKQDEILDRYGIDLSSIEAQAEAKKLMAAIGNRLYRP